MVKYKNVSDIVRRNQHSAEKGTVIMKKIIKETPFGYKTSTEIFDKIITTKYNNNKNIKKNDDSHIIFERYYDFIFSSGALRDWIIKEYNLDETEVKKHIGENKYFNIIHSLYNNTKHYTLTENKQQYNVVLDGKSLFNTDNKGRCIWTQDFLWDNEAYWID